MADGLEQKLDLAITKTTELIGKFDGLEKRFVLRAEFEPVRAVVYGMVGMILIAAAGSLISLVVKGAP